MKKCITIITALALMLTLLVACGGTDSTDGGVEEYVFDATRDITVVSREEGSGTRGAFIELFKVEVKNADGKKVDYTTEEAVISNSTSVMMTTVEGNDFAIGYISLGSLNDTVKALSIDGVEPTVANIKSGSYKISRPFNIATKDKVSTVAQDFIDFIMSKAGQKVIADNHYIEIDGAADFTSAMPKGKVVVAGSSSVSPVMEKLREEYLKINTGAEIEIQTSDSSTGMTAAMDGICDIGMASRELKDEEKAVLTELTIAMDGIAVIVNKNNPLVDITSETVRQIFTGELLTWEEVIA